MKVNDLLIEIKATSVNPFNWKVRKGYLANAISFHSPAIIRCYATGIVKDMDPTLLIFVIENKVFTSPDLRRNGTYAEYVAVE